MSDLEKLRGAYIELLEDTVNHNAGEQGRILEVNHSILCIRIDNCTLHNSYCSTYYSSAIGDKFMIIDYPEQSDESIKESATEQQNQSNQINSYNSNKLPKLFPFMENGECYFHSREGCKCRPLKEQI